MKILTDTVKTLWDLALDISIQLLYIILILIEAIQHLCLQYL